MKTYTLNILIGIDQLVNTLIPGGAPDETMSSRAHRMREKGQRTWGWTASAIDALFFWQRSPGHCERAYLSEVERRQLPDAFGGADVSAR